MPGTPLRGGSCTAPPASHTGSLRLARAAESTPQDEAAAAGQGWVCGPRSAGGYGGGRRLEEEEGGAAGLSPGLLEAGTHLWLACGGEGNRTRGDTQTFGGHVWVDGNAIYEGGRPGELGASSRGTHGPGAQAGPTVRQPGLGRAEAMWPCAEGALVCEETDEPLNGVTVQRPRVAWHTATVLPPLPKPHLELGSRIPTVGAKRLFPPPFPPSLFFPGFAKIPPSPPPAGAWPEGSLFSPATPVSRRPRPGGHTMPFAPSSGLRLLLVPCPQVPEGLPLARQCSSPRTGLGASWTFSGDAALT